MRTILAPFPGRIALSPFLLACLAAPAAAQVAYPETRRVDHVDELHGVEVPDPYRWLEADVREDATVADWVEAQNVVTFGFLGDIEEREAIEERLTELWDYERYSAPSKEGGLYLFSRNDGLQDQAVLYAQDSLEGEPRVLLDPNTWSEDGTVAYSGGSLSDDGRHYAYAASDSGSDWNTVRVRDVESGADLPETLEWVKWSPMEWTRDGAGFFYTRFPAPAEGEAYQGANLDQELRYHRVGTPQTDDVLVYRLPHQPKWLLYPALADDGRHLVITLFESGPRNAVHVLDLEEPYAMPEELIGGWDASYFYVGNAGSKLLFRTDLDAPNGRLVAVDPRQPEREHWRTVIAESRNALETADVVGESIVAQYLEDAASRVEVFTLAGEPVRTASLPGIGTASGFTGEPGDPETFYGFSSFATPPEIHRLDVATGESRLLRRAEVDFDPADYVVERVFVESADGTRVPLFLAHRTGLEQDGSNPVLLYGYGGFNVSMTPGFSPSRLAWMEMGGVFAQACLRGGGEYGEAWHEAGTKLHKQNVFDDFVASAEWLIESGWTRPERLAIQGGSNGGLLVGAAMTQRPELFGAALPAVGVMDMLRFHHFTAGRFWTYDYGSADDPAEFQALLAYSPYHNLREGTSYPATLVTTADTDDRVVPAHSFKFAAALQHAQAGEAPVLIRVETSAGHGAGKPTSKRIAEVADQWAFLVEALGEPFRD